MTDKAEAMVWPTFLDFWNLYDYKLDRARCERMWKKMNQRDKEKAMQHAERYVAATFTDGRFPSRRHPGTYLHNANWNDEALIRKSDSAREKGGAGAGDKERGVLEAIARQQGITLPDNG